MTKAWILAVALSAWVGAVSAQTAKPVAPSTTVVVQSPANPAPVGPAPLPQPAPGPTPVADGVRLLADTPVRIELAEAVSSNGRTRGEKFAIRLAAPIVVDGRTVAPAGATGEGEVVYAEAGGAGGSPGKLVLAARYIDVGGVRVRLKAFNLAAAGESNFREMQVASAFLGVGVMLINGHDVLYPIGTRARAKIAEDVILPAGPLPAPDLTPHPPPVSNSPPATALTPATIPAVQESAK